MTDCENVAVRERLPDLLHERLEPRERVLVQRHLAGCAGCAAELALLHRVRRVTAQVPAPEVGAILAALPSSPSCGAARVSIATAATAARRGMLRRRSTPWRRAAAAALAAAALVGVVVPVARWQQGRDDARIAVAPIAAADRGSADDVHASTQAPPVSVALAAGAPGDAPALSLGGVLTDLSDAELETLIAEIDDVAAVPAAEPRASLLIQPLAGSDDLSSGGRR
jgi:hypothetical protein